MPKSSRLIFTAAAGVLLWTVEVRCAPSYSISEPLANELAVQAAIIRVPNREIVCNAEYSSEVWRGDRGLPRKTDESCNSAHLTAVTNADDGLGGVWLTADGSTRVRFEPCGARQCGRIVWLREPIDPSTGKPWLDAQNEVQQLRNRPLLGISIVTDLTLGKDGAWNGALYNPLDGKTYRGSVRKLDDARIELKGCVFGIFCKDEIWTRGQ
jgi:uncharacterized protein (DUF2147 family)